MIQILLDIINFIKSNIDIINIDVIKLLLK